METEREFSLSRATTHRQYFTDNDDDSEEEEEERAAAEEEEESEVDDEEESKSLYFMCGPRRRKSWSLGQVLDPRAKWVQEWNRVFLLVCATGLFVDPLFFYALAVSDTCMCLFVDGWFAITVTALRCMTDALHVWNMWLQLKMAKRTPYHHRRRNNNDGGEGEGGEREGEGEERSTRSSVTISRHVAYNFLKAKKGFFFDVLVILPLPQVNLIFINLIIISYKYKYQYHDLIC